MGLPTLDQVTEAIERDNYIGFCLACGNEQEQCEPDACNYECESCGEFQVFGSEEILLQGRYK